MKKRPGLAHFIENMCCNFKGNPKAKKCYSIHWARQEMKNVRQTDCFWMNEFGFDFRMPFSITMRAEWLNWSLTTTKCSASTKLNLALWRNRFGPLFTKRSLVSRMLNLFCKSRGSFEEARQGQPPLRLDVTIRICTSWICLSIARVRLRKSQLDQKTLRSLSGCFSR